MIYHLFFICQRAIKSDDCKNNLFILKEGILLYFLAHQKSISQRHWDQILCQRHNFIASVYCWTLCNNRMDLIILWAVAHEIMELERKFMPVLWTTQDPADLKRSQKIIEPFQWAIGSKASLVSQRHHAISGGYSSSNAIPFHVLLSGFFPYLPLMFSLFLWLYLIF